MSIHRTATHWTRRTDDFRYDTYSRDHELAMGAGTTLAASAAAEYRGNAERANPEDLLVAALSSCHMLTFLAICARQQHVVDRYDDEAEGHLEKGPDGRTWVTRVVLRPRVQFATGTEVDERALATLHAGAHRGCFIASSVKTQVTVEPRS